MDGVLQMHHADYTKPLAVEFLCLRCHAARHRRTKWGVTI
jgi:hypothetical protein